MKVKFGFDLTVSKMSHDFDTSWRFDGLGPDEERKSIRRLIFLAVVALGVSFSSSDCRCDKEVFAQIDETADDVDTVLQDR